MRLIYLSGLLLCGLFACQSDTNTDYTLQPADATAQVIDDGRFARNVVQPPNAALDVPTETLRFDAATGFTYQQPNGTTLTIPAGAFVDAQGNPVSGEVTVAYREFHNAADVVVSGIPMKATDAAGNTGDMQTAGMLEVRAYQNDAPLQLAAGKALDLQMASHVDDAVYDQWYLDETTGEWLNQGVSEARPNPAYAAAKAEAEQRAKRSAKAPVPPVAFRSDRPIIDFDFNPKTLAELNIPKGVLWQYAGNDQKQAALQQADLRGTDWNFAELEPTGRGTYDLVLKNSEKTFRTEVAPTLKGAKLEAAMADYQQQLQRYQSNLREASGRELVKAEKAAFMRDMRLNNLGFHNFDLLMGMPGAVRVYASFDYGTGDEALNKGVDVFLITNDDRSVVRFTPDTFDEFTFSTERDNKLVALLPGNRVATFSQADFADRTEALRKAAGKGYTFKMTVHPRPLGSVKDLDRVLRKIG